MQLSLVHKKMGINQTAYELMQLEKEFDEFYKKLEELKEVLGLDQENNTCPK
jgi:predicted metalloenzyme YecM